MRMKFNGVTSDGMLRLADVWAVAVNAFRRRVRVALFWGWFMCVGWEFLFVDFPWCPGDELGIAHVLCVERRR